MGNSIGKICLCSSGVGDISRRYEMLTSNPYEKSLGNSICYTRPDPFQLSSCSNIFSDEDSTTQMTFRSISGASVSANSSTPPSIYLTDSSQHGGSAFEATASFESSTCFTSMPLHYDHPRGSSVGSSGTVSSFVDVGLEPRLNWSTVGEQQQECSAYVKFKRSLSDHKIMSLIKPGNSLKKIFGRTVSSVTPIKGAVSIVEPTSENQKNNEDGIENNDQSMNFQWAQGRAGEDRTHIVISEEDGWVFVGIYDGFNGPDATDYLLNNLFWSIHTELKELLSNGNSESTNEECLSHSDVLRALSEALRKTEDEFLKDSDETITKDPVLAMMGSCVLVVLMKEDDVYVMNVGDSRAILAQSSEQGLNSLQLTVDHSTSMKKEVQRIRREHPDDPFAVIKGRVKGHLNVTRAFGAGFLKQPKYNNAVLETFRVDYKGDSPYITCSPSLEHHTLSQSDKFLIVSSDGLYQYFTNEEAVSRVEFFITLYPERDPAQLLIQEALAKAATKAGMDFYELLEIPQGERRLFHDDISIVIISLEGKIWRSSASYTETAL